MQSVQAPAAPVEAIRFQLNFEGTVAAYTAVQEVHGEDHPLLQPGHETGGLGPSLLDGLSRQDDSEPQTFAGEDAATIRDSLEAIARPDSTSRYQATAQMMLSLLSDGRPLTAFDKPEPPAAAVREVRPASRLQPAPRSINGEIVEGHVILGSFEHLVTALQSVGEFAAGDARQDAIRSLERAVNETDPFNSEPVVYWGSRAQVIYNALAGAANRRSSLHDVSAAHMLEEGSSGYKPGTRGQQEAQSPPLLVA